MTACVYVCVWLWECLFVMYCGRREKRNWYSYLQIEQMLILHILLTFVHFFFNYSVCVCVCSLFIAIFWHIILLCFSCFQIFFARNAWIQISFHTFVSSPHFLIIFNKTLIKHINHVIIAFHIKYVKYHLRLSLFLSLFLLLSFPKFFPLVNNCCSISLLLRI